MADRAPPFLSDAPALTRLLSSGLQFSLIMGFEDSRVGDPFGSFCAQIASADFCNNIGHKQT
jgi:hypothetical protein